MKTTIKFLNALFVAVIVAFSARAQQPSIQNFRPYDKHGLNIFETKKNDTTLFTGFKMRIGLSSAFQFQDLSHENIINTDTLNGGYALIDVSGLKGIPDGIDDRTLIKLTNGFNLAMANLNLDAQLYDGVHMNLVMYLSSRHHQESWVKGGYIQFDKLTFLHSAAIDNIMNYVTLKFGDYEVNYGDQHYRRSDGGNSMYNPFVENLIMDEFTTEIGGEVQAKVDGLIGAVAMTGGEIKGDVAQPSATDSITGEINKRSPSIIGKIGIDEQVTPDLRLRLTGSVYTTKSSVSNTIFGGDRTGSRYFGIMENYYSSYTANPFSGRLNPGFSDQLTTFMVNPFVKFHGLELFGTLEFAKGRTVSESSMNRKATQYAVDVIYRFTKKENFFVAGRYNTASADMLFKAPGAFTSTVQNVTVDRYAVSAGWYIISNIMAKVEYVDQQYKNFPTYDIRNGGKFSGIMFEAALGF
jgi:hypothetical protein